MRLILGIIVLVVFIICGLNSASSFYYLNNKYNELDCDNLRHGILFGLGSILLLVLSGLIFFCNCCNPNKCIKGLSGIACLCILASTGYNSYLYYDRSDNCTHVYETKNIEKYYDYYFLGLLVSSVLILLGGLCMCFLKDD